MKTKLLAALSAIVIMVCGTVYFVGNYFVEYALKRGNDTDPLAPPPACEKIATPGLEAPPAPDFESEIWTVKTGRGIELKATVFYPDKKTHRRAILIHGYGRDQTYAYDYAEKYLKEGYVVITPDLRAAGMSGGTYMTMGTLEANDIKLWTEKIIAEDPDAKIILHGVSMGAATAMMTTALELPENVVALVEDCGYTSAYKMFGVKLKELFDLPEFPFMNCVDIVCKIKTGVFLSDAAPIESVKSTKIPTLFIHGDEDKLVPYSMMNELYDASAAPVKEKMTVEGAGHADAKNKDPEVYFDRVFHFLRRFAGKE